MPFVKNRKKTPSRVARHAERSTGKAIQFAANDVAEGMARKCVQSQQANVNEHDGGAEADTELAAEIECFVYVIPEKAQEEDREIKKVSMNVLEDEGKAGFALIVLAEAWLTNGTGRRIEEKGAIVGFAVVVASGSETQGRAEDE